MPKGADKNDAHGDTLGFGSRPMHRPKIGCLCSGFG